MSTTAAARKKKGGTPSASDAAAVASAHTLGRGVGSAVTALPFAGGGGLPCSLGCGVGLAPPPCSLSRDSGSAAAATLPATIAGSCGGVFLSSSASMDGFPFPPPFDGSCEGGFPSSSAWLDATGGDASSPGSCWMVQMERTLADANPETEKVRWNKPSIYRVPEWLKNMTNRDAYRPQLVSLGPFHHGEPDLLPMEEHKRRAVAHMVRRSRRSLREFVAAIEEVADKLMDAYDNLDEKWRGARRGQFVEMMVVDGCFLLEMVKGVSSGEAPRDYAPNDPVFSKHSMIYLWGGIQADMLAIENQLPLLALYTIGQISNATTPLSEKDVNKSVLDFTWQPLHKDKRKGVVEDTLSLHPLDIYHKNLCGLSPAPEGSGKHIYEESMRCAVGLKEKGIQFKKCESTHAIDFKNGVLSLPEVSVSDGNEKIFLNLMAFEQLHSGMRSDATAYLIFMDNIIDSERDVALLRSKGIIKHSLSSDRETANLFNILSKGGAVMSPHSRLHDVRRKVNDHCRKPWNKWMAIFRHTYASNPWVFISLVAAIVLLVSTILQTIYSVVQFYTKS